MPLAASHNQAIRRFPAQNLSRHSRASGNDARESVYIGYLLFQYNNVDLSHH